MNEREFDDWYDDFDLGPLEDVRVYVYQHAMQNAADVPEATVFDCAKSTIELYVDGYEDFAKETFDYYR